jgi:hypothetical protein
MTASPRPRAEGARAAAALRHFVGAARRATVACRIPRRMGVFVSLAVGLVIWIVLWATGTKAFDAFLIPAFLVVMAATVRIAQPYIEKMLKP